MAKHVLGSWRVCLLLEPLTVSNLFVEPILSFLECLLSLEVIYFLECLFLYIYLCLLIYLYFFQDEFVLILGLVEKSFHD